MLNKRTVGLTVLFLSFASVLSGCEQMIALSEDDTNRVVAYASTVISKFNKFQNRGIVAVDMTKELEEIRQGINEEESDLNKNPAGMTGENTQEAEGAEEGEDLTLNPDGSIEGPAPVATGESSSLTDVVGIDGVTFTYKTVMVNDNYGNTDYFVYEPTPGNSFVTAVFIVKNESSQEKECNIQGQSLSFTATVAGQTSSVYRTAFGDDLTTYNGKLAPGESKELTVLFQFPKETAANLNDFELTVIKGGVKYPVTL